MSTSDEIITLSYLRTENKDGKDVHIFKSLGICNDCAYDNSELFPINTECVLTKVENGRFPPVDYNTDKNSIYIINDKKVKLDGYFWKINCTPIPIGASITVVNLN